MAIILFSICLKYHRRKPPLQFCSRPGRRVDVKCSSVLVIDESGEEREEGGREERMRRRYK